MKKLLIGLFIALSIFWGEAAKSQINIGVNCKKINFHRPKKNCEKGFWICIKDCGVNATIPVKVFARVEDVPTEKFSAVFSINKESSTVTLRILRNLAEDPEYSAEELNVMTVDEDEIEDGTFLFSDEDAAVIGCHGFSILPGTYEVTEGDIEGVYLKVVFSVSITD
jgi:hypothetical protein